MRILITGGAGFIGSHLAEHYIERGDEVYIIDDLSTGAIDNIESIKQHPNFTYYLDSLSNQQLTAELVDMCDIIHHLAAAVGVRLIVESPVRTIETNIRGTEIILELAAKKHKRVVVASSSEVYGKRDNVPFREDDDLVLGPTDKARWSYACSKMVDECLAFAYWKEHRVPTVIVRLFNTVGPRQTGRYGMVVPSFVRQALSGQDITVFGDGTQSRCFTHVLDVVRMLIDLAEHPQAVGQVYNIGSNREIKIVELAQRVKELTESDSRIVMVPYDLAYEEGFEDMTRRVPDISKIRELLGYVPTTHLDEILTSVITYERTHREAGLVLSAMGNGK